MQKRRDRFFLRAVVSRNASQGGNFARAHQVEILASDLGVVLEDDSIDLVVIATRHHEHADQVVRALTAGKHVFVEKPLAITWSELDRIATLYRGLDRAPLLMVGFNRRFSPALTMIKGLVEARRAPLVIEYRLNAGYIPLDHWVHGPQGGGRNIGEACHMYDVFRFLAGAPVRSLQAAAIDPGTLPYRRNDNFSATIGYEDGTLAHLLYTSLGPKSGIGKERIEVFCDGETYVVDDFKRLIKGSDGAVLWQSHDADKGHEQELSRFGDVMATGGAPPIPFDELVETSAVALSVEDLLAGRAGADES
jgi:predicted dehydrogenase